MFKIKIADFVIEIDNKYDFIYNQCRGYIYEGDACDMRVGCTRDELEVENTHAVEDSEVRACLSRMSENDRYGYLESICTYRTICLQMPQNDAFIMHSAVIEVDNEAYAFAARSGTGKSTHISLWKKHLGDRVQIVNGDKPIIRLLDGVFYAYGTPWCGKEGWNRNVRSPLKSLCFLERAKENRIEKMDLGDAATLIMKQILMPKDSFGAIQTLELVDKMLNTVDCWRLGCNISEEAAEIAYNAMSGGKK